MYYCKTCKALCYGDSLQYDGCKHKLVELKDVNEPVRLCVIGGTERALLTGMLRDAEIPFLEENVQPQGVANETVTGFDVKLSNISLLVPFSALPKASELLSSLETVENTVEPHMEQIKAEITRLTSAKKTEDKPMSPALRTTVKIITALLFLAAVAVVVLGTDKIMEWVKSLF